MKKLFFGLIIGLIFGLSYTFAFSIDANNVSYKPTNNKFNADKLDTALDTLYSQSSSINKRVKGTVLNAHYNGSLVVNTGATITLSKGNYLVFANEATQYHQKNNNNNDIALDEAFPQIVKTTGATCNLISSRDVINGYASNVSSYYRVLEFVDYIFKCSVSTSATIKIQSLVDNVNSPYIATINAIKID